MTVANTEGNSNMFVKSFTVAVNVTVLGLPLNRMNVWWLASNHDSIGTTNSALVVMAQAIAEALHMV